MTYGEIRKKSKKQLFGIRFRAACSLAAFCAVKLFFVFLNFANANFFGAKESFGGFDLAFSSSKAALLCRLGLFLSKLLAVSLSFAALLGVYCQVERFCYFKCLFNLIKLRIIIFFLKLPYLACTGIFLIFARKIFLEYGAGENETAIAVIMLICALCFLLIYLYFLQGLFAAPLLIAQGDSALCAARRSQRLMKGNRARLIGYILISLPEALCIFLLPQIVMRFAVFSGDIAHIYCDDV